LITDDGPSQLTLTDGWPQRQIRIFAADVLRPDVLQR
jgi:hypothetical protein